MRHPHAANLSMQTLIHLPASQRIMCNMVKQLMREVSDTVVGHLQRSQLPSRSCHSDSRQVQPPSTGQHPLGFGGWITTGVQHRVTGLWVGLGLWVRKDNSSPARLVPPGWRHHPVKSVSDSVQQCADQQRGTKAQYSFFYIEHFPFTNSANLRLNETICFNKIF